MNAQPAHPKRVLVVTETGDAWPSGRIRALIYRRLFQQDGIAVDYLSRCTPWLTKIIEQPGAIAHPLHAFGAGRVLALLNGRLASAREMAIVRRARAGYHAVYLQKVASWPLVAALRHACPGARLVYDLNDSVWLPARAGFAGGRVIDILQSVDAVTCDNPAGLQFARRHNASVFLVPDPAQVELFDEQRSPDARSRSRPVLGWIGSPATLFNLYAIWEPLEALFAKYSDLTLRLVGVGRDRRLLPRFENVRYTTRPFYSSQEMIQEILQMDIGLFPMFDVEDSRARGILKATLYMSGGACVVASPVGQMSELITDGVNGLLAHDGRRWLEQLSRVVEDATYRHRLAAAGLATVRERFTIRQCYEQLLHALSGPAGRREMVS